MIQNTDTRTDQEIIRSVLQGRTDDFSILVDRYQRLCMKYVRKMVWDYQEASDMCQEVFLRCYEKLELYNPLYKFSTWVIRISHNLCVNYLKSKSDQKNDPFDDSRSHQGQSDSPDAQAAEQDVRRAIFNEIIQFDTDFKAPLILRFFLHFSYQDIAEILNLKLSTVKSRIHDSRKILKEKLVHYEL